ncbi:MAG: tetratricopeptide repeat protein [Candidatus Thermoplasmatota archaeon]|nr:tetratricopeptide repeat protein [Candidatus Thermoplasmatota archaeon]
MQYPWNYLINTGLVPEELGSFFDDLEQEEVREALRDLNVEPWLKDLIHALLLELGGDAGAALRIVERIDEENFYVLYNRQRLCVILGDLERAEECEKALKKMDLDRRQRCLVENEHGKSMWKKSLYGDAIERFTDVLETALELGDKFLESTGYNNIAIVLLDTGEYQQARELFTKALEADSALKNERGIAISELNLGECCRRLGDLETAKEFFNECIKALEVIDEYERTRLRADCYWNLGQIFLQERNFENAAENFEKALEFGTKTKDEELLARIYLSMGHLAVERNSLEEAKEYMQIAYEKAKAINSKKYEGESYALRGRIHEKERKYAEALQSYGLAIFLFRQINDRYNMAKMEEAAGSIYLLQGDKERAIDYFKKAKAAYAARSYRDFVAVDEKLKEIES